MADIGDALRELGITGYVMRGIPTNETEFNAMFRKATVGADGTAVESSDTSNFGVTWSEVSEKLAELQAAEPMRLLRRERNRRLMQSDWMAGQDRTMTQAEKDYRQALRDITDSATSLDDVTWPTKP